jgi:hypothetical protein
LMALNAACSVCHKQVSWGDRSWVAIRPPEDVDGRGGMVTLANLALVCPPCAVLVQPYGSLTAFRAAKRGNPS